MTVGCPQPVHLAQNGAGGPCRVRSGAAVEKQPLRSGGPAAADHQGDPAGATSHGAPDGAPLPPPHVPGSGVRSPLPKTRGGAAQAGTGRDRGGPR